MTDDRNMSRNRDLVLPPRTQAYVLDTTKGKVSVYVGPSKTSLSDTDRLVRWDKNQRQFVECADPNKATINWAEAGEGQYIALLDPSKSEAKTHPSAGVSEEAIELSVGRKVVIPGPISFPLWPGQTAEIIDGHRMATNQYVVVRVCQPEEANKNWMKDRVADSTLKAGDNVPDLEMGQLMIIKGTDVSFYIPSTGFEVVPDENGKFVRSAVTLEQLEYSILLDENGKKRYVRGPDVVFPEPTETFIVQDGQRKFPAIELSPQSGVYVKVTAAYEENDKTYNVGDEIFITGNEMPFYFPRAEHSVIKYGDRTRHHAIAIPEGEGRYVLNRNTGIISLVRGPNMYLPNPINEVIVKRILDPETVRIMYPNNQEALQVNEKYTQQQLLLQKKLEQQHTLRHELQHGTGNRTLACSTRMNGTVYGASADFDVVSDAAEAYTANTVLGDRVTSRNTAYAGPRTIVLDTKYEGAVAVNVWPGYAVCIVDKAGKRRVEVGPKTILLEYNESLMVLELSTGIPKDDTKMLKTCYLRTVNNAISDVVMVETSDLVPVSLTLSYHVSFEGITESEIEKWFIVENYVKMLTDNCRSRLRNIAKRYTIQQIMFGGIDLVRDCLLGVKTDNADRTGLKFEQNGMRLYDVEVLNVRIDNPSVAKLLNDTTYKTLEGVVHLTREQDDAARYKVIEALKRQVLTEAEKTAQAEHEHSLETNKRKFTGEKDALDKRAQLDIIAYKNANRTREEEKAIAEQEFSILRIRNEIELDRLNRENEMRVKSSEALNANMIAALNAFSDREFVSRISVALGPAALAAGMTTAELLSHIFKDTPYASTLAQLGNVPFARQISE